MHTYWHQNSCSTPHHTIPYHTIPYHTIPYHTTYHTTHTIPYHTIPHRIHHAPRHSCHAWRAVLQRLHARIFWNCCSACVPSCASSHICLLSQQLKNALHTFHSHACTHSSSRTLTVTSNVRTQTCVHTHTHIYMHNCRRHRYVICTADVWRMEAGSWEKQWGDTEALTWAWFCTPMCPAGNLKLYTVSNLSVLFWAKKLPGTSPLLWGLEPSCGPTPSLPITF